MNDTNQKQLGNVLWAIADQLRGAMDADDFRDYMLLFLFGEGLSRRKAVMRRKRSSPSERSATRPCTHQE